MNENEIIFGLPSEQLKKQDMNIQGSIEPDKIIQLDDCITVKWIRDKAKLLQDGRQYFCVLLKCHDILQLTIALGDIASLGIAQGIRTPIFGNLCLIGLTDIHRKNLIDYFNSSLYMPHSTLTQFLEQNYQITQAFTLNKLGSKYQDGVIFLEQMTKIKIEQNVTLDNDIIDVLKTLRDQTIFDITNKILSKKEKFTIELNNIREEFIQEWEQNRSTKDKPEQFSQIKDNNQNRNLDIREKKVSQNINDLSLIEYDELNELI